MVESLHVLKTLNRGFTYFLEQGDPRVKEWPLMRNPFPGWVMIAAYIYFVKAAGPQWMKKKQPFDLRKLMVIYNFAMVFANLMIFLGIGWYGWFTEYSLRCQPVDYSNRYEAVRMAEIGWWFYITKFIEFADTVFFVLRKKDSHISALHVIHHSVVPFSLWFGVKFAPGGYNAFFPFLNSLVHVIMYTYYGLAALGQRFQKYLFWKKYMTFIQMGQFVVVVVYGVSLLIRGCEVSRTFIAVNLLHAVLFFALFYNFFRNRYGTRPPRKITPALPTQPNGKLCNIQHVHKSSPMNGAKTQPKFRNGYVNGIVKHLNEYEPSNGFCSLSPSRSSFANSRPILRGSQPLKTLSANSIFLRKRFAEGL